MRRRILIMVGWMAGIAIAGLSVSVATPGPQAQVPTIEIAGSVMSARPEATIIFRGSWGSAAGQFGIGEGTPRQGPATFGVSPDGNTIAVLDSANGRVQVFIAGALKAVAPVSREPYFDILVDDVGDLLLLRRGPESAVVSMSADGSSLRTYSLDPGTEAQELIRNGDDIWVWGEGDVSYPVVVAGQGVAPELQPSGARPGIPAGTNSLQAVRRDVASAVLSVVESGGARRDVAVASPNLPVDSIRPLGVDEGGNLYAAVRVWAPEWQGTESWYFFAVNPADEMIGHLRLPLDYSAGGNWRLGPNRTVYEMRSTATGLEVLAHMIGDQS